MNAKLLRCKNPNCSNKLKVQFSNAESKPIIFCSMPCFNAILEHEKLSPSHQPEDPNELRLLVKNLVTQTKNMQKEIENLREVRKTYFDLFKSSKLKDEVYKREWSFQNEEEK
jgi:hypothetical protein